MPNGVREERTQRGVRSVDHAVAVLAAFQSDTPVLGLGELSQRLGLTKSSIHALLVSLERGGLVVRHGESGKYGLGPRLLHLANLRLEHTPLRQLARPFLERLALQLQETAYLGVVEGEQVTYADRVECAQRLRMAGQIGIPVPLHATALGKALLAHLPEERVERELAKLLVGYTLRTRVEPDQLRDELRLIRRRGFAVSIGEREDMVAGVAAPVFDHTGAVVAGLTVAGLQGRFVMEEATELTVHAAAELSALLGAPARKVA